MSSKPGPFPLGGSLVGSPQCIPHVYTANMELSLCLARLCFHDALLRGTKRKLLEVWGQLLIIFIVPVPTTVTGM